MKKTATAYSSFQSGICSTGFKQKQNGISMKKCRFYVELIIVNPKGYYPKATLLKPVTVKSPFTDFTYPETLIAPSLM